MMNCIGVNNPVTTACLLVLCLTATGCGGGVFPVRSAAVTVTVVDEETNAPLEGVVAVGYWPNIQGTLAGSVPVGVIEVKEVVTNAQGKFTLPGWWKSGEGIASPGLTVTDPVIYLYKAGYWPRSFQNDITRYDEFVVWPDAWRSDLDGKTIQLKPIHSANWNKEQWKKYVDNVDSTIGFGLRCYWKKVPRQMIEVERQWIEYRKKFGAKVYVSPISRVYGGNSREMPLRSHRILSAAWNDPRGNECLLHQAKENQRNTAHKARIDRDKDRDRERRKPQE